MKFRGLSLKEPRTGLEHVLAELASIFEAIRVCDADWARLLMRSHLEGSRDRVFGGRMLDLAY
jgi:GntR family transcriptional repressor for pyruvate dehydrogenase complex